MKYFNAGVRFAVTSVLTFCICVPAYSGFFDQLVDEAKKTMEGGLKGATDSTSDNNEENSPASASQQCQPETTTAQKQVAPAYDNN